MFIINKYTSQTTSYNGGEGKTLWEVRAQLHRAKEPYAEKKSAFLTHDNAAESRAMAFLEVWKREPCQICAVSLLVFMCVTKGRNKNFM